MKHVIVLAAIVCRITFGQSVVVSHRTFVDSLLTALNDRQLNSLYERLDRQSQTMLQTKIASVDTVDHLACENICESFSRQKVAYDSSRVPKEISAVYNAASRSIGRDELKDAVKVFYVAFALKLDFVQEEKIRLQQNYDTARRLFAANDLDSLGWYLEQFSKENRISPAFITLENETHLSEFYRSAGKIHAEHFAALNYEHSHAEEYQTVVTVEIGGGAAITSRRMSPDLYKTDYVDQVDTLIARKQLYTNQPQTTDIIPNLSVSVKLFGSFHAVVSAAYQKTRLTEMGFHSSVMDLEFFNSDFLDVSIVRYSLGLRYLIRNKVGLRPFVEAGAGTAHSRSEYKKLLAVYRFTTYAMNVSEWTPFIQLHSGMEYVPSAQSSFIFAVKFGGEKYLGTPRYTGEYSFYLGGTINIVIL
ncbi:MAG: hypothetical protein ACOYNS_08950 [Bacteroidota bacterium]